jgi:homocitrate synthase
LENKVSINNFNIIDSTLREGEQFINAFFTTQQKIRIAQLLNRFGVEYIELTSPVASPQSEKDCQILSNLGLQAKLLTHIRCNLEDAKRAVGTGVHGVNVVIGTSSYLREFSHGKSIEEIVEMAVKVISYLKTQDIEVRFSTEDSLRSNIEDIISIYKVVDNLGIDRIGIADTVGISTPQAIYSLVKEIRGQINAGIEFHGHNDCGSAIANAYAALEAGATYIDTSILGIGERNGITSLGGLIARLYTTDSKLVEKYNLKLLQELDSLVAKIVGVDIPFNNYITGIAAFTHKAGIHAKAVLNNPSTYEILSPEAFGLTRNIHVASRLTGWNAVHNRAEQLNLKLSKLEIKKITSKDYPAKT